MIVQRGYYPATSLHSERLRQAPLGHFFSVITNGYGVMPDYASQIAPIDRWAITAYIRALQLSQNAKVTDIPSNTHASDLSQISEEQGFNATLADQSFWHNSNHIQVAASAKSSPTKLPAPAATVVGFPPLEPKPANAGEPATTKSTTSAKPPPKETSIAAGQKLYEDNCSNCHQSNLAGRPPKFPSLIGIVSRTGEEHVRTVIVNGVPEARPMMPAFDDRLSPIDVNDMIAYIRSITK
jgi:mono/diheme cytochrome c family protein